MRKIALTVIFVLFTGAVWAQSGAKPKPKKVKYDAKLAKQLGADERGMKPFVMVFLKRGPGKFEKAERDRLVGLHLENIGKLAEMKKLVLAGPFMEDGDLRGIYIFDVATVEEAKALTETDPAVKAGVFSIELHPWYGSAALVHLYTIDEKIKIKNPGQ
jgi:uncharacterized protein YciI